MYRPLNIFSCIVITFLLRDLNSSIILTDLIYLLLNEKPKEKLLIYCMVPQEIPVAKTILLNLLSNFLRQLVAGCFK